MVSRRFRTRRRFRRSRRKTAWTTTHVNIAPATPGSESVTTLEAATGEETIALNVYREGLSVARILLNGTVNVADPASVNSGTMWFGIVVADNNVIAAAAYPVPGIDAADWMYLDCRTVSQRESVVAGYDPASSQNVNLDLRSRRRFRSPQDRLLFVNHNDAASVGNVEAYFCVRTLWLLP